ncbi:MAG: helix-turn-helix domain-containing protein [Oceanobacter sp.]
MQSIARYHLYSESPGHSDPEFVHIEDIPSRARLFDWSLGAHTHPGMFQVVYIACGKASIDLDGQVFEHNGPCFVGVPAGVVHSFEFERDLTQGWVLTASNQLLQEEHFLRDAPFRQSLLGTAQAVELSHEPDSALRQIDDLLEQLNDEFLHPGAGQRALLSSLLQSLLIRFGRILAARSRQHQPTGLQENRYDQLMQLIEQHFREHWPVSRYAEVLNTTVSSLNRTCNQLAGQTAGDLIQSRLVLESQRLLIYTSVPVSQIGYELGFVDPAYFSRFFRKHMKVSPTDFRLKRHTSNT